MIGSLGLACLLLIGPQTPAPAVDRAMTPDRGAARVILADVLAQRAFSHARSETWTTEFRRRAGEWLTDLWARMIGTRFVRPSSARAVAWIASIAAACVLIVWLWRIMRRDQRPDAFELEAPIREERRWSVLAQEAVELIRGGRIREGARVAYRAAVQRLAEDGAFAQDATRTPREYLRLVPEQHRRRPALSMLTSVFERIWYGSRAASADEGREIVTLLQELECLPREQAN